MRYINRRKVKEDIKRFRSLKELHDALYDITNDVTRDWERDKFNFKGASFDFQMANEEGTDVEYCRVFVGGVGKSSYTMFKLTDKDIKNIIFVSSNPKGVTFNLNNSLTISVDLI